MDQIEFEQVKKEMRMEIISKAEGKLIEVGDNAAVLAYNKDHMAVKVLEDVLADCMYGINTHIAHTWVAVIMGKEKSIKDAVGHTIDHAIPFQFTLWTRHTERKFPFGLNTFMADISEVFRDSFAPLIANTISKLFANVVFFKEIEGRIEQEKIKIKEQHKADAN